VLITLARVITSPSHCPPGCTEFLATRRREWTAEKTEILENPTISAAALTSTAATTASGVAYPLWWVAEGRNIIIKIIIIMHLLYTCVCRYTRDEGVKEKPRVDGRSIRSYIIIIIITGVPTTTTRASARTPDSVYVIILYVHYNASSPVRVIPVNRMGVRRRCDTVVLYVFVKYRYTFYYYISCT